MAVGKSTTGPLLARLLSLPFADLDAMIEAQASTPIRQIFRTQGEAAFRAMETDAIRAVAQQPPMVLSLGGGTLHQPGNLALLRDAFDVVVLTASLDTIRARVSPEAAAARPLWTALDDRYEERLPGYLAAGPNIITDGLSPEAVAAHVAAVLAA